MIPANLLDTSKIMRLSYTSVLRSYYPKEGVLISRRVAKTSLLEWKQEKDPWELSRAMRGRVRSETTVLRRLEKKGAS